MRVPIIGVGVGVGGLALAQGLVRHGIDVRVYERHTRPDQGLLGYGIHVNADGKNALRCNLTPTAWAAYEAAAAPALDVVNFHTERLRPLAHRAHPVPSDPLTRRRAVGVVRARFADGTEVTGDLLVGADGARSTVRAHPLPLSAIRLLTAAAAVAARPGHSHRRRHPRHDADGRRRRQHRAARRLPSQRRPGPA